MDLVSHIVSLARTLGAEQSSERTFFLTEASRTGRGSRIELASITQGKTAFKLPMLLARSSVWATVTRGEFIHLQNA